jgi:hypothetical protein
MTRFHVMDSANVRSVWWRLAIALGVTVLAASFLAADGARQAGQVAGLADWRVAQTFGPVGGATGIWDISALGDHGAVATGYACDAACNRAGSEASQLLVERWNGVAWSALPGPAGLAGHPEGMSVSATSANDVWVAALGQAGPSTSTDDLPYVLHWNDGRWTDFRFARGAELNQVIAFSDSDVWVFGAHYDTDPFTSYDLHYDGHTWRKFSLPVLDGRAGATSASDMWMIGRAADETQSRESDSLAVHWDGHVWQTMRVPVITAPPGRHAQVDGTVVAGPDDVWTSYGSMGTNGCCELGGLLHWADGRWQRVGLPGYGTITTPTAWMDQDGHGGLWLIGQGWLAHYSNGSWARTDILPVRGHVIQLSSVTWIPGARSIWVGAWITPKANPTGSSQFALLELPTMHT